MGERIAEIVAARGKLHNPDTESGGVLCGAVTAIGEQVRVASGARRADRDPRVADPHSASTRGGSTARSGIPTGRRRGNRVRLRADGLGPAARRPTGWRRRSRSTTSAPPRRRPARWRGPATRCAFWGPVTPASWPSRRRARRAPRADAGRRRRRPRGRRSGHRSGPLRHRRDRRPARPARGARRGARRGRAAGRPDGGGGQRHGLRAHRDPAHRRGWHGALLLDGDELLGGGAGRRRDRLERPHAGRQRLHARSRRLRPRPGTGIGGAARGDRTARRGESSERRRAIGCRCVGATSTGSATSTTASS